MEMHPQNNQYFVVPWPAEDESDFKTVSEEACYLDEDTITVILMQAIMQLPVESRRKLLMFMHQADDPARVAAEMRAEPDERLELRLTYRDH